MNALKKLWKIVRGIVLTVLCVLAVLIVFVLAGGLGPVVKYVGVPAARAFGVPLSIEKCVILPLGGYVRVEGVEVANPKAFAEAKPSPYGETPLARIGRLEVDVAMRSLLSKELCVDSVELSGVRALYAFDLDTTNVDALLKQMGVDPNAAKEEAEEVKEEADDAEAKGEGKAVRIAYFHMEDNSVSIRKFVTVPIPLPPLTLHDVDNHTLKDKIEAICAPVVKAVSVSGKGLSSSLNSLGQGSKDAVSSGANAVGEGAKALGDSIKGLFSK